MVSTTILKQGDVIKIQNWFGVVQAVHFDELGNLSVIQVQTARNVFRGYGPEYIDVRLNPSAIEPATRADLEQEIEKHRHMLNGAVERLLTAVSTEARLPLVGD